MTPPTEDDVLVPAKTLADHILWLRRDRTTTPRGLIKLVYLSHAWCLGLRGKPLVTESVMAGRFGPIFTTLDREYALFGSGPIVDDNGRDNTGKLRSVLGLIEEVNKVYGAMPDERLSMLTHLPDTPWSKVHGTAGEGAKIDNELIREYYVEQIEKVRANAEKAVETAEAD